MTRATLMPRFFYCFFVLTFFSISNIFAQPEYSDFPWLHDFIDVENCCNNQTVTAYQSGIFTFIYVEKIDFCGDKANELYFEDGTFYCEEFNDLDCRAAYGLTEENATVLWDCSVAETITICAGETIFLDALQQLPAPPLPAPGPNGEIPDYFCIPPLTAIEITPTTHSRVDQLKGFYVSPVVNTLYTLTSIAECDGPDLPYSSRGYQRYLVLVEDENCQPAPVCENVLEQDWIQAYLEEDCTGDIYTIDYNGTKGVYISTLCACLDDADIFYSCTGEVLCSIGGLQHPDDGCDATIKEQLTTENLIWTPECDCPCPLVFTPVCGADGQMYETPCEATCAGIEIVGQGDCEPAPATCKPLEALNLNPSFCQSCIGEVAIYSYRGAEYVVTVDDYTRCTDGITVVTHCDSTTVFCYQGGIAGFNQCTKFFEEAIKTEIKWSREKDCNTIEIAGPCNDLTEVDFGLCEAIMGVGLVDGRCVTVSGCLDYVIKGVDYKKAFFPTVELCRQNCDEAIVIEEPPAMFEIYDWLSDLVDPYDCKNARVEVYDLGPYSYLHIESAESGQLYFEDGTFYCMDQENYDCRSLYNLGVDQITDSWTCIDTQSGLDAIDNNFIQTKTINNKPTPSISAFPNPTNGLIQVQIKGQVEGVSKLKIYDLQGRLLQQKQLAEIGANSLVAIDLSNEMAGLYLVEWQSEGFREMIKVVKQ